MLVLVVSSDSRSIVDDLITKHGLNRLDKDNDGNTPLHLAASHGQLETVEHLITLYKCNTEELNSYGVSSLCQAVIYGRKKHCKTS